MTKPLHESATSLAEATTSTEAGLLEVEFITPGWGSSGYYSREVVEAAAPLFKVGTQMFFDHPSATESSDRPERSVRDLAAVIEEAGTVNSTTGGVRGKVRPLKAYSELLTDEAFAKNVGLSIRGSATDITVGEAEGRTGPIVEGLADLTSVDFVTRAGRGGRVLAVLESARIVEGTANDTREQLQTLVRDAYGAEKTYVWVRDFDPQALTVWFEVESGEDSGVYGQSYADTDGVIALSGDRTEVRVSTTYVPVTRPDSTTPTTEADQEVTMGNIQIEESEHRSLVEKAGRVDTLESERDTAIQERDQARAHLADLDRTAKARKVLVDEAAKGNVTFTPLEEKGLLVQLPTTESGDLDEAAFTTTVTEAVAQVKESRGEGRVSGFGGTPAGQPTVTEADIDGAVGGVFGRQVKEA